MLAQEIIRIKRDGGALAAEQVQAFVAGLVDGGWSEGQAASLAMAIFLRGMNAEETVALTRAMTHSGEVLSWADAQLNGPVLDKHSTGGVGDKVSLMLAPIVAACGGFVPMISGRGLGHTGGTLDKLDAIPGYRTAPDITQLRSALRQAGCAIVGQTATLAPADRRLYAIRDVTATVESIPLITASILSKKLAAGLQGLVMDVKCGNGAFSADLTHAQALAQSLVQVAGGAGLPTRAFITDMNQVLGHSVGNALEVREAVHYLMGVEREPRLHALTRALSAELLVIGGLMGGLSDGLVRSGHGAAPVLAQAMAGVGANMAQGSDATAVQREAALARVDAVLANGSAMQHFERMVAALGGPSDIASNADAHLPAAPVQRDVLAPHAGWVSAMHTRDIGVMLIELGGGRRQAGDAIDHRVGFSAVVGVGQRVEAGQPLVTVHAANSADAERAAAQWLQCVSLSEARVPEVPVLIEGP
ncbi:MAG: hypothetical protein RJA98_2106 [Pseudomonadota bacterium]|jgi:thymidine phosphorylase